jgi:hypothetical protein
MPAKPLKGPVSAAGRAIALRTKITKLQNRAQITLTAVIADLKLLDKVRRERDTAVAGLDEWRQQALALERAVRESLPPEKALIVFLRVKEIRGIYGTPDDTAGT